MSNVPRSSSTASTKNPNQTESSSNSTASSAAAPIAVPFPKSPSTSRRSTRSASTYSISSRQTSRSNPTWRALSISNGGQPQSGVSLVVAEPQLESSREKQSELVLTTAFSGKGSSKRSRLPSLFMKRKSSKLQDMLEEDRGRDPTPAPSEANNHSIDDATIAPVPPTEAEETEIKATPIATDSQGTVKQRNDGNGGNIDPLEFSDVANRALTISASTPPTVQEENKDIRNEIPQSRPSTDPDMTPKASSSTTSWLSSFGRSKGKEAIGTVSSIKETPDETPQNTPVESSPTPIPEPTGLPTSMADADVNTLTASPSIIPVPSTNKPRSLSPRAKRSWLISTSPSSPSPLHASTLPSDDSDDENVQPRPHRQETVLSAVSTSSFPSSIDEERVPSLARTPDEEYLPLTNDSQGTVRVRLNSLTPSTRRFSLAFPLLGRQKVKLEDVVTQTPDGDGKAANDTVNEQSGVGNEANADVSDTSTDTIAPDATSAPAPPVDSNPTPEPKSDTSQWEGVVTDKTTDDTPAASARYSWWDYVGWGGTTVDTGKHVKLDSEEGGNTHEVQPTSEMNVVEASTGVEADVKDSAETGEEVNGKEDTAGDGKVTIETTNKTTVVTSSSSGSWFGWGATRDTSTATDKLPVQALPPPESSSTSTSNADTTNAPAQDSSSSLPQPVPPPIVAMPSSESQATIKPSETTTQTVSPVKKSTASVFSSDTLGAKPGSWFAPWTWGTSAGAGAGAGVSTSNDGAVIGSAKGSGSGSGSQQQTMTESEKIKEEALARQRELDDQKEKEREESERQEREREREREEAVAANENPLSSAISSRYSSGWASIFGTVSKRNKMITENGEPVKRDENGVEIMDLDEDEEGRGQDSEVGKGEGQGVAKNKDVERVKASSGGSGSSQPVSVKSAPADASSASAKRKDKDDPKGKKKGVPPPTITVSDDVRKESESLLSSSSSPGSKSKKPSPTPSVKSAPPPTTNSNSSSTKKSNVPNSPNTPPPPRPPNLVLPTWADTFHTAPRSVIPPSARRGETVGDGVIGRLGKVGKWLLGTDNTPQGGSGSGSSRMKRRRSLSIHTPAHQPPGTVWEEWGKELPRALDVIEGRGPPFEEPPLLRKLAGIPVVVEEKVGEGNSPAERMSRGIAGKGAGGRGKEGQSAEGHVGDVLRGCKNIVVIGIHGWFPGAVMRTVLGEPTGTSPKFVNMMVQALEEFQDVHNVKLEKITKIPLEGEGTINGRVEKLYNSLLSNKEWMSDLHNADAIFVATHSQGSVVSTHLLDRLIRDRHIRTAKNAAGTEALADLGVNMIPLKPQRVCCLALCGIHLGPLRYLSSSALLQPYIQYFESTAARELFDFQNTESEVSKAYVKALENVVYNGTKMVYVASMDDQVVPIYSGLFTSASHPLILRALYIDGDAYSSSDFLSNLLVLLLRVMNCGLSESGLLAHLSDVTAGTLSGVGHSTAYEELSNYALAVNYLFLTNDGLEEHPKLRVEPFNANAEQNDYEIPWALRDLIADERVAHFFSTEISQLRDAFREWNPKTTVLKDVKRKLQPIQRLPSSFASTSSTTFITSTNASSVSKL
ncbi:hypothetical protein L218DRAFT_934493 [Marasmius fiardii PR-910]|nr:hypothetical protein L218DRAFT_934493 [Marasmius fiardii PR-910]